MTNANSLQHGIPGRLIPCLKLKAMLNIFLAAITLVKQTECNSEWKKLEGAHEMPKYPNISLLRPKAYN